MTPEQRTKHALHHAQVKIRAAYTVSQVAAILGVSGSTVRNMCARWEQHIDGDPRALEHYLIGVLRERRIPHHAILQWFDRAYKDSADQS